MNIAPTALLGLTGLGTCSGSRQTVRQIQRLISRRVVGFAPLARAQLQRLPRTLRICRCHDTPGTLPQKHNTSPAHDWRNRAKNYRSMTWLLEGGSWFTESLAMRRSILSPSLVPSPFQEECRWICEVKCICIDSNDWGKGKEWGCHFRRCEVLGNQFERGSPAFRLPSCRLKKFLHLSLDREAV